MNTSLAVQHLFPNAVPLVDFVVQDDSDGSGPYIAVWNLTYPQPNQTEIETSWEQIKDMPAPKTELEMVKEGAAQQSADFQAFMDYYYSKNPE